MYKKNKIIICILVIAIVTAAVICILVSRHGGKNDGRNLLSEKILMGEGIELQTLSDYTGPYVEDGSNEPISGVLAARFVNKTDRDLEYAVICLNIDGESYLFSLSAIPAGASVVALETEKKAVPEKITDIQAELHYQVFYTREMDLAADKLAISGETGSLRIKNISDSTIENTIYVCYKNVSGDAYLGGIAYRAKIAGGMAPGAEQKISAAHFDSNSKIIFVSYGT